MNLLCPSCQKMLTVPDQFAGQLMKCPLCSNSFTVPGLPSTAPAAAPSTPAASSEGELYGLQHEPAHSPPSPSATRPFSSPLGPVQAGQGTDWHPTSAPPAPAPSGSAAAPPEPEPSPSAAAAPLSSQGYLSSHVMYFSPRVLPWIAPACLLLIFVLTLFPWVGVYPGGVPWVTGSAWGAAFGFYGQDHDLDRMMRPILKGDKSDAEDTDEADGRSSSKKSRKGSRENEYSPGMSALLIFYCFLLLLGLPVVIASVALPWLPRLPPRVDRFVPWRWGIVAAVCLVLFLFLALQMLIGFSVESKYSDDVQKYMEKQPKGKESPDTKQAAAEQGRWLNDLTTTFALKLAVLLHLVAILSSLLMFWVDQRGSHRPPPRLEVAW